MIVDHSVLLELNPRDRSDFTEFCMPIVGPHQPALMSIVSGPAMLLKKVDGVWLGARLVIASGLMRAANRLRDAARWVPWRRKSATGYTALQRHCGGLPVILQGPVPDTPN